MPLRHIDGKGWFWGTKFLSKSHAKALKMVAAIKAKGGK